MLFFLGLIRHFNVQGIVKGFYYADNWNPWASLGLDKVQTFMDYYTVVFDIQTSSYKATHGFDYPFYPAICVYGWCKLPKYNNI